MSINPSPDIWRQRIQLGIAVTLVILAIGIPIWYVIRVGITSDELVQTMITGFWVLTISGAGTAYSLFELGRKVT
jgi:hypothetical protein